MNKQDFLSFIEKYHLGGLINSVIWKVEKTKADFKAGVFKEFHPYQTKTGFQLGTWKEAMEFNNYHEGIHLGIMMSIKKHI